MNNNKFKEIISILEDSFDKRGGYLRLDKRNPICCYGNLLEWMGQILIILGKSDCSALNLLRATKACDIITPFVIIAIFFPSAIKDGLPYFH